MATKEQPEDKRNRTTIKKALGKGSFGTVYEGTYTDGDGIERQVAVKKVYQDKRYKNRELDIMKMIKHPNIVELYHHYISAGDKDDDVYLNLVMELIPDTGYKVTKTYAKKNQMMPSIYVKLYSYQILRAIAAMHSLDICHRDIKPQNLLIDPETGRLVICDLGSAKQLVSGEPNVAYICSRYYRAPELIFGCTYYTTAIDIWSVGCVIGEFIKGRPMFAGESGIDQLIEIIKLLGTPSRSQMQKMNSFFEGYKFPHVKVKTWEQYFDGCDDKTIEFLKRLITYAPQDRITAIEALAHPWFDEIKQLGVKLPENSANLPELFNWTTREIQMYSDVIRRIEHPSAKSK
jgi:glycogen synthase kinase 3 beta